MGLLKGLESPEGIVEAVMKSWDNDKELWDQDAPFPVEEKKPLPKIKCDFDCRFTIMGTLHKSINKLLAIPDDE